MEEEKKRGTCKKLFDIRHLYVVVEKLELCQLDFFQFLFFSYLLFSLFLVIFLQGVSMTILVGHPVYGTFFEWYQIWHFLSIAILDLSKGDVIYILTMGALLLTNMYLKKR